MKKTANKYGGVIVPMVTPVTNKLEIDNQAVENIITSFIRANVSAFVLGTTGESVSVSEDNKHRLVKTAVKCADNQIMIYAGISSNCVNNTIDNAKRYADLGADAVVAHLPYYYPLSDNQMLAYFEHLAENVDIPLVLYNNPITVKQSISLDVIAKLSEHPNIIGLKDSERGMDRLNRSLDLWRNRDDFSFLLGWAAQSAYALENNADGIVPSTGNITPGLYSDLYKSALSEKWSETENLQQLTNEVSEIYQKDRGLSDSLAALKCIMSIYGLCKLHTLPPLTDVDKDGQLHLKELIEKKLQEIKYEIQ